MGDLLIVEDWNVDLFKWELLLGRGWILETEENYYWNSFDYYLGDLIYIFDCG